MLCIPWVSVQKLQGNLWFKYCCTETLCIQKSLADSSAFSVHFLPPNTMERSSCPHSHMVNSQVGKTSSPSQLAKNVRDLATIILIFSEGSQLCCYSVWELQSFIGESSCTKRMQLFWLFCSSSFSPKFKNKGDYSFYVLSILLQIGTAKEHIKLCMILLPI